MSAGQNVVSRNFAVLSVGQMASRMLAFAVTWHVGMVLLPERFGVIALATAALMYAGLVIDCGFTAYGPFEVSRGRATFNKLVGTVIRFRAALFIPAVAILAIFAWLIPISPYAKVIIDLYGISLITNALDLSWFFLGGKEMWPSAVAEIIAQAVLAAGAFAFIHGTNDLIVMPVSFFAGRALAVSFLLALFVRRHGWPDFSHDWTYLKELIASAIPLCGSQVMGMITTNFDVFLVTYYLGTQFTGFYEAANRIVWVPTTIALAYYAALRPLVAHAYIGGFQSVEAMFNRSVRVTTALSIGIIFGGITLAQPLMLQIWTPAYAPAVLPFQILLAGIGMMFVRTNYRLVMVTFNQQVVDFRIMAAAAALNIGLNLTLIAYFRHAPILGITAAAFATFASEGLILVLEYLFTRRLIKHVPLGRYTVKPIFCSIIMVLVLYATAPLGNVFLRAALGGMVYALLMVLTGIVTREEIRAFISTWIPAKPQPAIAQFAAGVPRPAASAGIGQDK
jgi:O-antigen/teichoic acid export membrane protein